MDVNMIPWTQDGVAGCYLQGQDESGNAAGTRFKLEGMNSFDTQRNVTERSLPGDNTIYIKNSKFQDFAITANFAGLIGDVMEYALPGVKTVDGDVMTFDETVTGQAKKVVLYQVSDLVSKNGDVGQSLETFWDAQFTNLGNPKTSGELVTWQGTISALAKERSGLLTPRQWKFFKNGIALPAIPGGDAIDAPEVDSTTPAQGATGVSVSANLVAVFSEDMDVASLSNVILTKASDGTRHALNAPTYNVGTKTATWTHTNLSSSSLYVWTLEGGKIKSAAGAYLDGDVYRTFTTA